MTTSTSETTEPTFDDLLAEMDAAGIDVDVAWTGGGSIRATGNSFAAPVIAGHLARIVATHPGISTWQAKTVLSQLAVNAARWRSAAARPARPAPTGTTVPTRPS